MSEWRYELRVRYSPDDLEDLYEKDRFSYFFFYDQVKNSTHFFTVHCSCTLKGNNFLFTTNFRCDLII